MKKNILCIILALVMLLQVSPFSAYAASVETQSNINALGKYYVVRFIDGRDESVIEERFYSHKKPQEIGEFPAVDASGYIQLGWFCEGEEIASQTKVRSDMDIVAVFEAIPQQHAVEESVSGTYMSVSMTGSSFNTPVLEAEELIGTDAVDVLEAYSAADLSEDDLLNVSIEVMAKPAGDRYSELQLWSAKDGSLVNMLAGEADAGSTASVDLVYGEASCFALVGIRNNEPAVEEQELSFAMNDGTSVVVEGWLPVYRNVDVRESAASGSAAQQSDAVAGTYCLDIENGWTPEVPVLMTVVSENIKALTDADMEIFVMRVSGGEAVFVDAAEVGWNFVSFNVSDRADYSVVGIKPIALVSDEDGDDGVSVQGFRNTVELTKDSAVAAEDGLEIIGAYSLRKGDSMTKGAERLLITINKDKLEEFGERESLTVYAVRKGELAEVLADNITKSEVEIDISDVDEFAVVRDTGFRRKELSVSQKDGTSVKLSGMMPKDAVVSAVPENMDADKEDNVLAAYDISILEGEEKYQPDGDKPISVEISGIKARENADIHVWHIADDGSRSEVNGVNVGSNGTVSFTAEGFSVYVVIDHEGGDVITPRIVFHYINYDHTITYPGGIITYSAEPYNFLDKGGEYLATQIVKSGEHLVEVPTPPVFNQQYFNGWYVVDIAQDNSSFNTTSRRFTGQISYTMPNNPTRQTFNETISISMGDEDVNGIPLTWTMNGKTYADYADEEGCANIYLAPLYANFNYVNFFDFDGNLIARKLLVLDSNGFSSMLVSDLDATSPIDVNHYFMGWSTLPFQSGNNPQTSANTVPIYKNGYKRTTYITLYGGLDYEDTHTLDIYYGDDSYSSVAELAYGTLKFDDFDTTPTGGDVNFYAEYELAHWLRFIAGENGWGALYVPADFLVGSDAATILPTTSRTGYHFDGWYSGYQDQNGTIWYYQRVSDENGMVVTTDEHELIAFETPDGNASNDITVTNYQGTTNNIDYEQTGTVSSVGLQLTDDSYLFAKWVSNDMADYKVIIWQQKVSDLKSLPEDQRSYDYVNSYTESAAATSLVTLPSTSQYLNRDFTGFHLSRYDKNVWIDPQNTSVINVYYDRDLRAINFYYYTYSSNVTAPSDAVDAYQYTETTVNTGTQYGLVDDKYVQLTYDSGTGKWMAPEYVYQHQVDNTNGTIGLVNGEYVQLIPVYDSTTTYTANYTYTSTTQNQNNTTYYGLSSGSYVALTKANYLYTPYSGTPTSGTYYGYYDGAFVQLYYNNGTWYRTRSWNYTYSNPYSGTFYSRSSRNNTYYIGPDVYDGTRYTRANDGSTDVTSNPSLNTAGMYYVDNNGGMVPVTARTTSALTGYAYDDNGTMTSYSGDRYSYVFVATGGTAVYDQTRFTRSTFSNSSRYRMVTWSGLYGQTLAQNGYHWSDVDGYRWYEGITSDGTGQTYLDSFVQPSNPYNLRTSSTTGNYVFYHYRQQLDGTYSIDDREAAYSNSSTINFNFTNKFEAFTVSTYSTSAEGFSSTGGTHSAEAGTSASLSAGFHVYHTRNSYNLTFATNYPGEAQFTGTTPSTNFDLPGGVYYEQPLTAASYATPTFAAPDHYVFDGWYEDASGTKPFVWSQPMPAANKVVYAKWYPVYYRIEINPNGGVLAGNDNQNQSTYFWLQYGQTIGQYATKRNYIQANSDEAAALGDSGTYYYRYVSPTVNANGTVAEHSKWNPWPNVLLWESSLDSDKDAEGIRPSYYRLAEYIKVEDYHTGNDAFYQHLLSCGLSPAQAAAWDAHYVDTSVKYRPVTGSDLKWVLVGWYKNGSPYDFSTAVVENTTLTAIWRQAGSYYLYYNPRMEIGGVVGTLTSDAYDPGSPTAQGSSGYIDKAITHAATAPENITGPAGDNSIYVFEGWRVVNANGNPLDEDGNVMTEAEFEANSVQYLFQPGDEIIVRGEQAHFTNDYLIVELQAYYKRIEDSHRYPQNVQLILDANDDYDGYIDSSATAWPTWVNPGNSAVNAGTNLDSQLRPTQIAFGDAEINQAIHLVNYRDFFAQTTNDFLLGFDTHSDPALCENGPYIPKYAADAVIGIDDPSATNILYAIWEPMVYVTFVNHTGAPVTINLDSLSGVSTIEATIINNATQTYDRTAITEMDAVTIGSGQTVRIVLPQGMVPDSNHEVGRDLTLTINNSHVGFKMSCTKQVGDTAAVQLFGGDPEDPSSPALESGQSKVETQALIRSATGIIYTLTEDSMPHAYFDPNGGTWTDASHTTNNMTTWGNATRPNGQVFLSTTEQNAGRTQYKIQIAQFMKPASDPTAPSHTQFLGWTINENVARFVRENGDFSLTVAQLTTLRDNAGAGTDNYAMYDALLTLIEEYKAAFGITEVTNLLHVVENYSLWNFNNEPAGATYYAVYAQTADVNYHIMLAGGTGTNYNHVWALSTSTTAGATCTGQAGAVYTLKSANESSDNNRSHLIWYSTVVKGRSIIKPPDPSYRNNNNYKFLYWLQDDASHTTGSTVPSNVVAYSFADPIKETVNLYTSWTEMNYTTLRAVKVVSGVQSSTSDLFRLRYEVTTYKYTYVAGQLNRAEYGEKDQTGIALLGTTSAPGTEMLNYRDIKLYYWTDADGALYCQSLTIWEENLSESGYELVITDNDTLAHGGNGRTSIGSVDSPSSLVYVNNEDGTNYYRYYPVSNHYVEEGSGYNITYAGEKNSKPIWRFRAGSYDLYFWNNTWYVDYQCSTAATSAQQPSGNQTATFTNSKNPKVRFVKTDENGYDRLNGATFTISKINSGGAATSQVLTFHTGYVRTINETASRNGRFILAAGSTIDADSPVQMDTDHNEIIFTEAGTYRLTETVAPSGYDLPSDLQNSHPLHGVNYVDIVVSATGITIGGGNTAVASTEPLSQLNIGEFDRDNEYAVVIKNAPKTVYFKLQKVDTSGNPILTGIPDEENNPTSGVATFTASGTATASGVWVSLGSFSTIVTGTGAAAYTPVLTVPYGTFTVAEATAPVGYRTAESTRLTITDDAGGNTTLIATGGNVYGTVSGTGTEADPFIVKIQDEELGYNLLLLKTVVNDPEDGVERIYTVSVIAQDDTVSKVSGKTYNVVKVDAENNSTNISTTFSSSGIASVTIKDNESITLRSLPRGSYVVSESATATNADTSAADHVPFATSIVVMEPATNHTLVTTTTNTTSAFTLSNNARASITNTFGHAMTISKVVVDSFNSVPEKFSLTVASSAITHYTYAGSRSDDGGVTFTVMDFAATPASGATPGRIEFTTRNNNLVNGGPITDGTVIVINGILDGTYEVAETIPAGSGYTLTATVGGINAAVNNNAFQVTVNNADVSVVMINERANVIAPTGLSFSNEIFLAMLAFGALIAAAGVFLKKKEADGYET